MIAIAQGPLSLGGFGGGSGGNSVQVNHLTVGRVPGGALVQVDVAKALPPSDAIALSLKDPDFVSAGPDRAGHQPRARRRHRRAPSTRRRWPFACRRHYRAAIPELMARLEPLSVDVDAVARVVINERTGTVVVGGAVRIGPAAVAHGNLSVRISTQLEVSQPAPFSQTATRRSCRRSRST